MKFDTRIASLLSGYGCATTYCAGLTTLVDNMKISLDGVMYIGADGVLHSLAADHSSVLDNVRLAPAQIATFFSGDILKGLTNVDGRDVVSESALFSVPDDIDSITPTPGVSKRSSLADAMLAKRDRCTDYTCFASYQCQLPSIGCSYCFYNFTPGGRSMCEHT